MTVTDERMAKMSLAHGRSIPRDAVPPGPRLPAIVQSMLLMRFRHWFVPAMHRKYGDVFTIRLVPEGMPLVYFTRPDQIKELFAGDPDVFHAGKGNAILGPIMGEHSVLLVDGGEHRRARKLLMPAFGHAALARYREIVERLSDQEIARWESGVEFRSLERMNALTLEIILQVVFGVTDEARLAALRPVVNKTVNIGPAVLLGWGYPKLQKFGIWKKTVDNQRVLDRLLYEVIAERRTAADVAERDDVLSQLLSVGAVEGETPLTDAELRDQLVTLLLAGHETTASALSWTLYELGRHPELMARAAQAAADGDDDFLEACMKEAMRLHPVIPMVLRQLQAPATIGGIDLPAGAAAGASIIISHGRADNHEDPTAYRPDRFVGGQPAPNTWIPFGGGVRRCIGAGFSLMEGVVILRHIVSTYDVSTPHDDEPQVRNITSVPKHGARIVVTRR
jgi:cytochrome P450